MFTSTGRPQTCLLETTVQFTMGAINLFIYFGEYNMTIYIFQKYSKLENVVITEFLNYRSLFFFFYDRTLFHKVLVPKCDLATQISVHI